MEEDRGGPARRSIAVGFRVDATEDVGAGIDADELGSGDSS